MKDYTLFQDVPGESAFMAGVVEMCADWLASRLDGVCGFEADVFPVWDGDTFLLEAELKRRLLKLWEQKKSNAQYITEASIRSLRLDLIPVEMNAQFYISNACIRLSNSVNAWKKGTFPNYPAIVKSFLSDLSYYLGQPVCVYEGDQQTRNVLNEVVGSLYMGTAFETFFVSFHEWTLLLMFGAKESL